MLRDSQTRRRRAPATKDEDKIRQHSRGEVLDVVQIPTVGSSGVQSGSDNPSPGLRGVSDTAETNVKATWALRDTQTRKVEAQGW